MSDDKNPVEKALDLCVYAPVGAALYVRDMLPGMMGIFVMRGKREIQGKKTPPAPPMPPPVPADEVKRRIDESVGVAKVVAESGFGVAKDVAGAGIGVARDVAGSALKGLLENRPGTRPETRTETRPETRPETQPETQPGTTNGAATTSPTGAPAATAPAPAPAARPGPPPEPPAAPTLAPTSSLRDATPGSDGTDLSVPGVEELAIPDYDELSASQVVERLEGLDTAELEAVRRYEAAHRGRNTILGKIAQLG